MSGYKQRQTSGGGSIDSRRAFHGYTDWATRNVGRSSTKRRTRKARKGGILRMFVYMVTGS